MTVLSFTKRDGRTLGWHHQSSVIAYPATDGVSDPLPIPPLPPDGKVTVAAYPGQAGDTAKVQYSVSPDADVAAGSATWIDWPDGEVTENTSNFLDAPITGLRFVSTTTATPSSTSVFDVVI